MGDFLYDFSGSAPMGSAPMGSVYDFSGSAPMGSAPMGSVSDFSGSAPMGSAPMGSVYDFSGSAPMGSAPMDYVSGYVSEAGETETEGEGDDDHSSDDAFGTEAVICKEWINMILNESGDGQVRDSGGGWNSVDYLCMDWIKNKINRP